MQTNTADRSDGTEFGPPGRDDFPIPGPLGPVLRREAGRRWWLPLIAGVSWFVIAWAVLRADVRSLATVGVLVGVAFVIAAINEAVLAGFVTGGWKLAHYALSVMFALSAGWAFVRPVNTFFALASALGLILFLQGALHIVQGIGMRDASPYWSLELISGVLVTALAIWVSVSDQVWDLRARAAFILLFVGLMAVFRGISNIVIAFSMLSFSRHGDRAPGHGDDARPRIPGQERRAPAEQSSSGATTRTG